MRFIIDTLNGYQIMPTEHLQNQNLSLQAKGLLSIMYSLPNDWDYSVNGLCKITNTGITKIRSTLAEIELNGYMKREQRKDKKGRFEYIYHVFFKKKPVKPTEDCLKLKRFKTALKRISRI